MAFMIYKIVMACMIYEVVDLELTLKEMSKKM